MPVQTMFFCAPQSAYMLVETCRRLRSRPTSGTLGGAQARPMACERCNLHPRVDTLDLPTVSLTAFIGGAKPASPVQE